MPIHSALGSGHLTDAQFVAAFEACTLPDAHFRHADHVRLGTQPLERPDNDHHLLTLLDMLDAEQLLMFSSDYPHWDFDSPQQAFPRLPTDLKRRIFVENARELYGL